jgi:LysR family hydrogen peroxide-inducible transcriptional activator
MTNISMKHLRYFEALARHRHFGRAAEASAISQPALSLQMKELEEILGAPLIERGPRQIRLTALGEELAQRARAILRSVDELADLARIAGGSFSGPLRIGVIPTVAPYLLPRLIRVLGESDPGLDLRPREAVTGKLIEGLMEGALDAALVALPRNSCWCGPRAMPTSRFRAPKGCARCGSCCSRRAIASAIRRCPSATCPLPSRAT